MKKSIPIVEKIVTKCMDCVAGERNYCSFDPDLYLFTKENMPYACPLRKNNFLIRLGKSSERKKV